MLIDCDSCTARPRACGDCIVTHLLQVGPVRGGAEDSWTDTWDTAPGTSPATGAPEPAGAGRRPHDRVVAGRAPDPDPEAWEHDLEGWEQGPEAWERGPELTDSEVAAVAVLSAGGLVPPLRLVTPTRPAPAQTSAGDAPRRTARRGARTRTG